MQFKYFTTGALFVLSFLHTAVAAWPDLDEDGNCIVGRYYCGGQLDWATYPHDNIPNKVKENLAWVFKCKKSVDSTEGTILEKFEECKRDRSWWSRKYVEYECNTHTGGRYHGCWAKNKGQESIHKEEKERRAKLKLKKLQNGDF